jgi:hypothetical protein
MNSSSIKTTSTGSLSNIPPKTFDMGVISIKHSLELGFKVKAGKEEVH